MLSALLNFHGDITVVLEIFSEPHGGKVTPPELLYDDISIKENLTNVHGVIATDLVIGHSLVLTRVLVFEEALSDLVLERSEIFCRIILHLLLSIAVLVFGSPGCCSSLRC